MHARWRVVCHMLLAAYHVVHWRPDNLWVRTPCPVALLPCYKLMVDIGYMPRGTNGALRHGIL